MVSGNNCLSLVESKSEEIETVGTPLDCSLYGAILRQKRMALGYKNAEDFIADMSIAGINISKASLYRIERGEQEPSLSFSLAANTVLCGNPLSEDVVFPCMCDEYHDLSKNANLARIVRRNAKQGGSSFGHQIESRLRQTNYESLICETSWLDYRAFVNGSTNEEELSITIADADFCEDDEFDPYDPPFTAYEIRTIDDIERSVILHLKRQDVVLPNEQIKNLIRHVAKVVEPYIEKYNIAD